jgi:hypothetical protein
VVVTVGSLDGDTVEKLRVENSKRGDRETPVPAGLASDLRTVANTRGLSATSPTPASTAGVTSDLTTFVVSGRRIRTTHCRSEVCHRLKNW